MQPADMTAEGGRADLYDLVAGIAEGDAALFTSDLLGAGGVVVAAAHARCVCRSSRRSSPTAGRRASSASSSSIHRAAGIGGYRGAAGVAPGERRERAGAERVQRGRASPPSAPA